MVVKIGGAALDDPAKASALWEAVVDSHRALAGRLALVHGGGAAVDRHLERLGIRSERREGIRITPREQIDEVVAVLGGRVNKAIVGALQRLGMPAAGLCLGDGGTARTVKATGYGFDPGFVGEIEGGDPRLVRTLMEAGVLPVLSSIGLGPEGEPLNVNADDAAAGVAQIIEAGVLVLMTDVAGILDGEKKLIERIGAAEVESLIGAGVIHGGMIPKARAAVRAAERAGIPCTITSWNRPQDLVLLAEGGRAGTGVLPAAVAGG